MIDRRRYPRVQADILYRPTGTALFHHPRNPRDLSLGGMRVYSDESVAVGSRLDLDVLLPDGEPVRCWAVVVWVLDLGPQAPARFDVGMRFIDMGEQDSRRLNSVLVRSQ